MVLYEIDKALKKWARDKFGKHHYSPEKWALSARVFIATELFDGRQVVVGAAAVKTQASGTVENTYTSHKVIILPPASKSGVWATSEQVILPAYDRVAMWRTLADTLAAKIVSEGKKYFCNSSSAPPELVAYRNDRASGWSPTSKDGKPPSDCGHRGKKYGGKSGSKARAQNAEGLVVSHWWVGTAPA